MQTVMITGCDSGIGREFAIQYAAHEASVIATYRDLENAITDRPNIRNYRLDVTVAEHFATLKKEIGGTPIDVLLSNAGIGLDVGRFGSIDFDYVRAMFEVNTVGPLRLVETFADNVAASAERRIAVISSRMGSIGSNLSGGHYGYRASKAGLNATMRSLAIDLFARNITVVLIHPGWVDTAGGGGDGPAAISVEDSVADMRSTISRLGNHETGQFLTASGIPLPW
jgi:NAD(P)-dependent dehydrogenase (short-subunit alcohol dehydrogenase family)